MRARLEKAFGANVARSRLIDSLFEQHAKKLRGGLVSDVPVSEDTTLNFNYLAWIKPPTSIDDVRHERLPAGVAPPGSLLYRLVRQAILLLYRSAALDLQIKAKLAQPEERLERELIAVVDGTENRSTTWQRFAQSIPNITGMASLSEYLPQAAVQQRAANAGRPPLGQQSSVRITSEVLPLRDYMIALEDLQNVPTAELERLTGETLDCCSHRLDAWITALATHRLEHMRAERPKGVHVGAFAWVEDLRANRATRLRKIDGLPDLHIQVDSGGFIHAPTLDQAAAAAILRNAYLTRSGEARAPYELDLSSARVRLARWLLASVREGQPLTALVGYQFERALHERQLDRFIEPLRLKFPLPTSAEAVGPSPQESIAPRDVVHGMDLRRAWREHLLDLGTLTTPAPSEAEQVELKKELERLDETVDAVADLLTADSVYQLVRGASSRAGASLDAVASDARPPEGEFARSPRGGTSLTHRVSLILGDDSLSPSGWDTVPVSPRASAEPRLDRWIGAQLGDPTDVRVRVVVPAPTVTSPDAVNDLTLSLDALALRPIDLVAIVPSGGAQIQDSVLPHTDDRAIRGAELERRIADAALGGAMQRGTIRLDLGRDPEWGPHVRSFAEIFEIVRALKAFISSVRALRPADLVAPEHSSAANSADLLMAESDTRAANAITALSARIDALDLAIDAVPAIAEGDPEPDLGPLRAQLKAASLFNLPESFPALPNSVFTEARALLEARIADVEAVPHANLEPLREALRRARQIGIAIEPEQVADSGSRADSVSTLRVANSVSQALATRAGLEARTAREALVKLANATRDSLARQRTKANAASTATEKMSAVFGNDFVWVPRFRPVQPAGLEAALAQGPSLGATSEDKHRWFAQAAQVRAPLRRWRRVTLYGGVIGTASNEFDLAQIPHVDPARWVALPFGDEKQRPPAGRVSLALFRAAKPLATDPWCGLLIDEWPETIPALSETSGLTFHYDDPGAEAAQTLLLAVPPGAARWDLDTLIAILDETLTLAKIRGVHSELLPDVGQLLPAIYLATNPKGDTISTDFIKDKAFAARIVREES